MKQFGVELDMVVETDLSVDEFNSKFIQWVESNGWVCGGRIRAVDEEGNGIKVKES